MLNRIFQVNNKLSTSGKKVFSRVVKLTFPQERRLLSPNHFMFVFQQPQRAGVLYVSILGRPNTLGYPRIGLTITKKNVQRAHERNRIKRLIRESFRLHQHALPAMDFVVIAKKGISDLDNRSLTKALKKLWRRYCHQSQNCLSG